MISQPEEAQPPKRLHHKLDQAQRREVVKLLAFGYSPEFIAKRCKSEWDISINPGSIRKNYLNGKKWQKHLERYRAKLDAEVLKHPLASKYNRLNILDTAVRKILNDQEVSNHGTLTSLVKEARAEIEGDRDTSPQLLQKITIINSTKEGNDESKLFNDILTDGGVDNADD